MGDKSIFNSPKLRGIAFWVVLGLVVWKITQAKAVVGAFVLFLTVGVIPGTQVTLSPDAVLRAGVIFFAISAVLIFAAELRYLLSIIFAAKTQTSELAEVVEEETTPEELDVSADAVAELSTISEQPEIVAQFAPALLRNWRVRTKVEILLARALAWTEPKLAAALRIVKQYLRAAQVVLYNKIPQSRRQVAQAKNIVALAKKDIIAKYLFCKRVFLVKAKTLQKAAGKHNRQLHVAAATRMRHGRSVAQKACKRCMQQINAVLIIVGKHVVRAWRVAKIYLHRADRVVQAKVRKTMQKEHISTTVWVTKEYFKTLSALLKKPE